MIYFTADQHFNHENIIPYAKRPFSSVNKMNNMIISNYRKTVRMEDTVYFLGDFTLAGPARRYTVEHFLEQLPGRKIFIIGNHDKLDPHTYVDIGFESVHTSLDIGDYLLTHDPAVATGFDDRKWLCGHVHTVFKMAKHGTVLNVGVDQWGFFPVSIIEVQRSFRDWRPE